jgi:methylaspartate ammonia-lyase
MTTQEKITEKLYEALTNKYAAQIAEAEATLMIYLNNPVGIGEHPQHLEEMDKFVDQLTNAKDKLEALQQFKKYS